jgi:serine protease inhibitor
MTKLSRRQALALSSFAAAGLLSPAWRADSETGLEGLSAASARFGLSLLIRLAEQGDATNNRAISPASIMEIFALADIGAGPELHATLKALFTLDSDADFDLLRRAIARLNSGRNLNSPLVGMDAIYVDKQFMIKESIRAACAALHAPITSSRLGDPDVVREINARVRRATKGAIPSIIDAPLSGSGMVLINALYFKSSWQDSFETKDTRDTDFHLANGSMKPVPMMKGGIQLLSAAQKDAFAAVRLPYEATGYSLILVVNREKPARIAEFAPVAGWLDGVGLSDHNVTLSVPRFSFNGGVDLLPALDAMGLAPARLRPDAFAGFSDIPLQISAVPHKVAITVDEGGTTAAAATTILAPSGSAPEPIGIQSLDFVADKPFMFALHEEDTGLTLMVGYIGDPNEMT